LILSAIQLMVQMTGGNVVNAKEFGEKNKEVNLQHYLFIYKKKP